MRPITRRAATLVLAFGGLISLNGVVAFGDENQNSNRPAALGVTLHQTENIVSVAIVIPGAPAAIAGLRVGDEIRAVDDQPIRTTDELAEEIRDHRPGSQVELLIHRNGARYIVKATLAAQASVFGAAAHQGRSTNNFSYRPASAPVAQASSTAQAAPTLNQEVGALHQQIARLQKQVEDLQSKQNQRLNEQQSIQVQDWGFNGRGNHDDDPLLFQ